MLPYVILEEDGKYKFISNGVFSLHQFQICGGITNSKFWDINLRYAQMTSMREEECISLMITKISEYFKSLNEEWTQIPRY